MIVCYLTKPEWHVYPETFWIYAMHDPKVKPTLPWNKQNLFKKKCHSCDKTSTKLLTNRCNEPGVFIRNIAYKSSHFTLIIPVFTKGYFLIKTKESLYSLILPIY